MAFDWRDFFLFAHELRNATDESRQRTSIGRAYYYAYNLALDETKKLGFKPNDPSLKRMGVHGRLWNWCLNQISNQDLVDLGDSETHFGPEESASIITFFLHPPRGLCSNNWMRLGSSKYFWRK